MMFGKKKDFTTTSVRTSSTDRRHLEVKKKCDLPTFLRVVADEIEKQTADGYIQPVNGLGGVARVYEHDGEFMVNITLAKGGKE